jgi:hypothetical protein
LGEIDTILGKPKNRTGSKQPLPGEKIGAEV